MGTQNEHDVDVYAAHAEWRERFDDPLRVKGWELAAKHSKPISSALVLTLKGSPEQETLEACEDGVFVFEIENHQLIAMACDILGKLDPVTNEQLFEKIRRLVGDRG